MTPDAAATDGRGLIRRRVIDPIAALLKQGISPRQLALSLAIGAAIGVFPILGTTTVICAAVALGFRLNLVAIQVANYVVYPLQLLLMIPFVRIGERLFGATPLPLSLDQIAAVFRAGVWHALTTLSTSLGHAVVGWAITAPLAAVLLFAALQPVMTRAAGAMAARRAAAR